jgi:hypothetical protein
VNPTRRQLMALLLAAQALPLVACHGDGPAKDRPVEPTDPTTGDTGTVEPTTPPGRHPFDVIEEIREALRASPDALEHEARRRIDAGDPRGILDFVRDAIALVPASTDGWGPAGLRRCGARGALRCGVGTMRDKAELLAWMFEEAGFRTRVVGGPPSLAAAALEAALTRPCGAEFAPAFDDAQVEAWRQELGVVLDSDLPVFDEGDAESGALAAELLASLPAGATAASTPFVTALGYWVLVEVELGGTWTAANPHVPGAVLGDSHSGYLQEDGAAYDAPPVEIEVYVGTTRSPRDRRSVLRADFSLPDLAGRQVRLAFSPALPLELWASTPVEQVRTFVPFVCVEGPDLDEDGTTALTVEGTGFGVDGGLYPVVDGQVTRDGQVLDGSPTDPALLSRVAEVEVTAGAAAFPTVELRVAVRGASGAVEGLKADAFAVRDEGLGVPAVLVSAEAPAPRVLLVLDQSQSIPAEFTSESAALLAQQLAEAVLLEVPGATFKARAVELGLLGDGDWTSSPAELADQVRALIGGGSELWMAMAAAAAEDTSVVVLITDGAPTDAPAPELVAAIQSGPPIIGLAVGTPDVETLDALTSLSKGSWTPIADADDAEAVVVDRLGGTLDAFYVLQYRAPADAPARRSVELTVATATGTATYELPEQALPGESLATVWLRVGHQFVDAWRRLGGSDEPTPDDLADVHLSLFATRVLTVELGAPTPSRVLDDLATALLSKRRQYDAADPRSADAPLEALSAWVGQAAGEALWATAPLPAHGSPSLGWAAVPRLSLWSIVPQQGVVHRELDALPLVELRTASADPVDAFETSLRRSMHLALAHAALYDESPVDALAGGRWVWLRPGDPVPAQWRPTTVTKWEDRRTWSPYRWLGVPEDGAGDAWWILHPESGTVVAAQEGGRGIPYGAFRDPDQGTIDRTRNVFDWGAKAAGLLGGGLGLGVLITVHKGVATLVIRSTIAIQTMDASGVNFDGVVREVLGSVVKQVVKAAIPQTAPLFQLQSRLQQVQKLQGIVSGGSLP